MTASQPTRRQLILLLVLTLISVISLQRGQRDTLEPMGFIYYVVDYSNGLIRRGLVGQCFMLVFDRAHPMQAWVAALLVHKLLAAGVVFGMLLWLRAVIGGGGIFTETRLAAIFAIFAAGQFYPTMLALTTYVDIYIFAIVLAGFALAASGRPWMAACVGAIGPFIHEMSVLLWAPLALMVIWRDGLAGLRRPALLLLCISPVLAQLAIMLFESPAALATQLARAPIDPQIRDIMAREQMGHTIGGDLAVMAQLYSANTLRAAVSIGFFLLPTLAMLAAAIPALGRRGAALLALAALAPLAVLALEFDLSRFVTMTQFTAICCVLFIAQTGQARGATGALAFGRPACAASFGLAAALFSLPVIYGYFDRTLIGAQSILASLPLVGPVALGVMGDLGTILH